VLSSLFYDITTARLSRQYLYREVQRVQPEANEGSFYNIGIRLDGKVILRNEGV